MKLRKSSDRIFYALTVVVILFTAIFSGVKAASRTYAEETDLDFSSSSEYHYVTIFDSGSSRTVKTDARTVGEVLERAGVEIAEADIVDPGVETELNSEKYNVNIYRARPVIVSDGVVKKYLMSASYDGKTVAQAAGFTVYDGDDIVLLDSTSDFLEAGVASEYLIRHNGGTTFTVEEDIQFNERVENDSALGEGMEELRQVGELGRKIAYYKVDFIDGKEASRVLVREVVMKEPVDRVTAVGPTKKKVELPATPVARPEWDTCAGWARAAGVSEADLETALTLIFRESGCRYNATNAYSGAYGIPQALPGSKMAAAGADWQTNPVTQIRWMVSYVNERYGGWGGAWAWWSSHHWY